MKTGIGNIYLAWRKGAGEPRTIIGIIKRNASGVSFLYIRHGLEEARKRGFSGYPDFPDESRTYTGEGVLDVFKQRLNNPERSDIGGYYSYWEINDDSRNDTYYLLAHTQGMMPTDNMEFLADYYPVEGMSFITELCGLTHLDLAGDVISEGDTLSWVRDPGNRYDRYAVRVYKGDVFVGWIKKVHSRVFYRNAREKIRLSVKSVNRNGHLNRAFIKVSF